MKRCTCRQYRERDPGIPVIRIHITFENHRETHEFAGGPCLKHGNDGFATEIELGTPSPSLPPCGEPKEIDLGSVKGKVLMAIRAAGPEGITADRVESETGLTHQSASARIRELVLTGHVKIIGKKESKHGRPTRVYAKA